MTCNRVALPGGAFAIICDRRRRPRKKGPETMTSMRDRIKNEAETGGFRAHPVGKFQATITEVKEREVNGKAVFELSLESDRGKARTSIWRTSVDDIDTLFDGRASSREEAEERYIGAMGRLCRLYRDLGLEEPDGDDEREIETQAFERLGELTGRACTIVVQEDKRNAGQVRVFVNAPAGSGAGQQARRAQPQAAAPSGGFAGDGLDDLPFMRRTDEW